MRLLRTLAFLWNILLLVDGSYSLITRITQLTGGGAVSILLLLRLPTSTTWRVILAVAAFAVFVKVTDTLMALFKQKVSARVLAELSKSKRSTLLRDTMLGIDTDLCSTAKQLSAEHIDSDLSFSNACAMLELLGVQVSKMATDDRPATRWDVARLFSLVAIGVPIWFSLQKKDFVLDVAVSMDAHKAGLGRYVEMSSRLGAVLAGTVPPDKVKVAYDYLKWSYGINSLLLLKNRDLPHIVARLPGRVQTRLGRLLHERDEMMQVILAGTMIRLGAL